jgi:hypothetical protein
MSYLYLVPDSIAPAVASTIDWNARIREQYTNPVAAVARVMRETTDRKRLSHARYMLGIARNPQYRFDLLVSDIPESVIAALQGVIADLAHVDAAVLALALRHRELESQGFAQDEIWNIMEDEASPLDFHYGDSTTLRAVAAAAN